MNNKHEPETAALLVQDQNSSTSPNHRRQTNFVHNISSFNQQKNSGGTQVMRDTAHDNFFEVQKIIRSQNGGADDQDDNEVDLNE